MANNGVDTFLGHMDTSAWRVTSLRQHPYGMYTHAVILQALIPIDLYDEIRHEIHTVAPYDYVIGYINPDHGCMRIKMHTSDMEIVRMAASQTIHVADIDGNSRTFSIDASFPDCKTCRHLVCVELRARQLQKEINMDIQWRPVSGIEYQNMVNDQEFQERWPNM
jgi:hypothetical protein